MGSQEDPRDAGGGGAPIGVLQVVLSLDPGGTERLVVELSKRLEGRCRTLVCCLDRKGAWAAELAEHGIPVVALGRRPGFRPALGLRIAALARRHGARVLHCHHYSPFVYGTIATLARPSLSLAFTEHGRLSDAPPSPRRRLANRVLGQVRGRFFAVSADLSRHLVAEGFPPDRLEVVRNGIPLGRKPDGPDYERARFLLGVPRHKFLIGTAARLDPVKDLGTLLGALAILRRVVPDAELAVIGEGPERERLEAVARAAGVERAVRFLGYRADARLLLPGLDAYANASTHEGVSLTVLEAMAAALPVVATHVGGTPEVVVHGETGLLVPPRSPYLLALALHALGADPDRAHEMGLRGRLRAEKRFDILRMVEEYHEVYRGLAERPGGWRRGRWWRRRGVGAGAGTGVGTGEGRGEGTGEGPGEGTGEGGGRRQSAQGTDTGPGEAGSGTGTGTGTGSGHGHGHGRGFGLGAQPDRERS